MALPKLEATFYDLTLPYSKKTIKFRPFVVGEQKQLMMALESRDENQIFSAIREAVTVCTKNTIDVGKLPLFELEYIFLNIRMKSVGEKTKILLTCGSCEEENEVDVNLEDVNFKNLDSQKTDVILINDDIAVRLKVPSLDAVRTITRNKPKEVDSNYETQVLFDLLVYSIDAVLDKEREYPVDETNIDEAREFLDSLSSEQFIKIQQWFENVPVLQVLVKHSCTKCGNSMDMSLEGINNFF
ncbi:MAG: hypothetical protein ACO26H_04315 [Sediminibacterium sp.]